MATIVLNGKQYDTNEYRAVCHRKISAFSTEERKTYVDTLCKMFGTHSSKFLLKKMNMQELNMLNIRLKNNDSEALSMEYLINEKIISIEYALKLSTVCINRAHAKKLDLALY